MSKLVLVLFLFVVCTLNVAFFLEQSPELSRLLSELMNDCLPKDIFLLSI